MYLWIGKENKRIHCYTDLNEDGTIKIDKRGEIKRSFQASTKMIGH